MSVGPKEFDVARSLVSHYGKKRYKYFMEGYGKVNKDKLKYYALVYLQWMILYHRKVESRKYRVKREIKLLKDIIYERKI